MAYIKQNVKDLIQTMVHAGSVVSDWDVLCSYDLQSLNKVLLQEYKNNPVNSELYFHTAKKIINFRYELSCYLKFGNPTLSFSTADAGTYDLLIPMDVDSYCNQTINGVTSKTAIPRDYNIVTSGPIKTVKGTGRNQSVISSDEIVEFGDHEKASVVLHFGKDLRSVTIVPEHAPEEFVELFEEIEKNFVNSVKEVDYDIVQVVKEPSGVGDFVLTPKSFMFTTMADERNKTNGVLNIWIQTNESNNPKGNPQPSFYPNAPILPVPLDHTSTIIFSRKLITDNYLKPALEKDYEVGFVDLIVNGTAQSHTMELKPRDQSKRSFAVSFEGLDVRQLNYTIDYKDNPFKVYTYDNKLHWVWNYETYLQYVETKVIEDTGAGFFIGIAVGGILGFLVGGPAGAAIGAGAGGQIGAGTGAAVSGTVDKIKQFLKLTLSINKPIEFTSISNTKFSAKINLTHDDIIIDISLANSSGFSMFKKEGSFIDWGTLKSRFIPKLQESIYMPEIDLGPLDYFAEANILFNEARFRISQDRAIHFPYDTVVIGDININETHTRKKRQQNKIHQINPTYEMDQTMTSSSTRITSPINTVVNWFSSGWKQLIYLNPLNIINKVFVTPAQVAGETIQNSSQYATNIGNFDVNSALMLGDLAIRSFTKVRPYNFVGDSLNFLDAKVYAINVITEFEEMLNQNGLLVAEFDPVVLMTKLEKEYINGNQRNISKILYKSVDNDQLPSTHTLRGADLQVEIDKMLVRQYKKFVNDGRVLEKPIAVNLATDGNFMYCL